MRKSTITTTLYVILVLLVVGGVIAAVRYLGKYTDDYTSDVKTFTVQYNGKILNGNTAFEAKPGEEYKFDVRYTFNFGNANDKTYTVKVNPKVTTDTNFTYTVNGSAVAFKDIPDLTDDFIAARKNGYFTLKVGKDLPEILQNHYAGKTVSGVPRIIGSKKTYFELVVTSHNGEIKVNIPLVITGSEQSDSGGTSTEPTTPSTPDTPAPEKYTVSGEWTWNDSINFGNFSINETISFSDTSGTVYSGIVTGSEKAVDTDEEYKGLYYTKPNDALSRFTAYGLCVDDNGNISVGWKTARKTIDFGNENTEVSNDFYRFLTLNAKSADYTEQNVELKTCVIYAEGDDGRDTTITTVFYEDGMNWGEWILSDYNTIDAKLADSGHVTFQPDVSFSNRRYYLGAYEYFTHRVIVPVWGTDKMSSGVGSFPYGS